MSKLRYQYPYPIATRSELAWRPESERQRIKNRYARTLGGLQDEDERDEEACKIVYVTQPPEREKPRSETEKEVELRGEFRAFAERLCREHPGISTDEGIFGGVPHIKNVRLSVGDVLAKLYVYGEIQKIVKMYSPHVSEGQVKEAIAYAQDFLQTACAPYEPSEDND